jgi:hypothetical protein
MDFKQPARGEQNEDFMCVIMWVFLRFGFSDSVMEKIAFNDPYRFVAAIIPGHRDLVEKERLA